jgi:GT2 family glycosyltransferase
MTTLAVIIINHHHGEMIRKTIESITCSPCHDPLKIFVINNVPDDATKDWLSGAYPNIDVIENTQPQGFASNANQVIKANPTFDYYLLLNPDVICLPGMVDALITVMENDSAIGAAGPELLNFDGSIQPSRRRFASFSALIFRSLHIDKIFNGLSIIDHYLMNDTNFGEISEVNWITGAVMILRKKALDQIGLMDERFYMYFEDEDLCCRMWQNGWKVCYVRKAQAYHAHLAAGRNNILSKANLHHVFSAIKMLIKYHGRITRCYDKKI